MFQKYDKKDKLKFIVLHLIVILGVIASGVLAIYLAGIELPTVEEKFKVGIGLILVGVVILLAFSNVVKVFVKLKSVGFLTAFLILLFLKNVINVLVITLGFVTIPLLFNDLVVRNYFRYLNMGKYWESYKFLIGHETV